MTLDGIGLLGTRQRLPRPSQATRYGVRRVMSVVAAPGCDARMHVTNMLATTRAMRALCVYPSETPCCRNGDLPPDAWECEWMCPYQH